MEQKRYSDEFKSAAVERYMGGGVSMVELSRETGVSRTSLYGWLRKGGPKAPGGVEFIDLTQGGDQAPKGPIIVEMGGARVTLPASMLRDLIRELRG